MRTRTACLALVSAALAGFTAPAHAVPITYTETATATGFLDGTPFANALVTITVTGDTAAAPSGVNFQFYPLPGATVTVAGFGSDSLLHSELFVNQVSTPTATVGFADSTGPLSILDTFNTAFSTYTLNTAIGPTLGAPFIDSALIAATAHGHLSFDHFR